MTQWGLDTLFNPAKRHMDEEKRRLQSTREQLGDSSGGKRIDLESGKVTIRRADADDDAAEGTAPADGLVEGAGDGAVGEEQAADGKPATGTTGKSTTGKGTTGKVTTAKGTTAKGTTAKGTTAKGKPAKDKPAPSPAAVRAAQRRGRQPR
jgi:hypothetical protein